MSSEGRALSQIGLGWPRVVSGEQSTPAIGRFVPTGYTFVPSELCLGGVLAELTASEFSAPAVTNDRWRGVPRDSYDRVPALGRLAGSSRDDVHLNPHPLKRFSVALLVLTWAGGRLRAVLRRTHIR